MDGAPSQQGMEALAQRRVERADRGEDRARLDDGVDAQVRPRPVGGPPGDLDLGPHEALVGDDNLQLGRLGDDRRIGADRAQHLLNAEARVLLVGHGGHDHVPGEPGVGQLATGQQRRRDARLHVVGTAAVQPVALHARHVRLRHALDADGVHVRAQEQDGAPARAARPDDHARTPRGLLHHLGLESCGTCPIGHEGRDPRLAGAAGHQRGIHGVGGDQASGELDDVVAHRRRCCPPQSLTSRRLAPRCPGGVAQ